MSNPRAALEQRLAALRDTVGWRRYEFVRDQVLAMQSLAGGSPSRYWQDELRGFEYLLDASPLVIERLRHHTHHVTGLQAYDYRRHRTAQRRALAAKLEALCALEGDDLLVPEAPELGGFGFEIDGALVNVDTLKFFEALIALRRGEVLDPPAGAGRRLVWEIGGGWGGFAYQFKRLFADTTYVIVDLPELFLFSATYLLTLFPSATARFHTGDDDELFADWEDVDFVFVPAGALEAFVPPRLDLVLNMVSFQEMTTEQVRTYVEAAHRLGAPYLYSLNRDRSHYNPEIASVRDVLGERYRLHEIPVLDLPYTRMPPPPPRNRLEALGRRARAVLEPAMADDEYRHLIGWRRSELGE